MSSYAASRLLGGAAPLSYHAPVKIGQPLQQLQALPLAADGGSTSSATSSSSASSPSSGAPSASQSPVGSPLVRPIARLQSPHSPASSASHPRFTDSAPSSPRLDMSSGGLISGASGGSNGVRSPKLENGSVGMPGGGDGGGSEPAAAARPVGLVLLLVLA